MAKTPRKKFETGEGNLEMIKNSVTAIKHHADELTSELKKNPEIEAWVLAKVDRAAQNLSDVTHYLDGEMNKFAKGGKTPIVRTQFEEEEFEYAKGGKTGKVLIDVDLISEELYYMILEEFKIQNNLTSETDVVDWRITGVAEKEYADGGNINDKFFTYLISWDDNDSLKVYKKEKSDFTNFSKQVERFEEMSKKLPYSEHWILNLREGQDPIENINNAPTVKLDYADGGMMAKGGEFKPYGKTKGKYKIEYTEDGEKQSEVWESKEMVEDRGKKLLKLGCTNIKITEVKKMARGGESKPSLIPDYKKISGVVVEDIDMADYPDFSDAYISEADYDGEPMTDEQLEELNQDGYFVYDAIQRRLFADGGNVKERVYIDYLNKAKGFKNDRKYFDSYEEAVTWARNNFDKFDTDYIKYEYARGGKVKSKRWIQDALSGNKGELRKTAKRKGLIKGDEKLSKTDLRKLEKMGGKTAKRARLAETLIEFKK
jgi:hypothetical protein